MKRFLLTSPHFGGIAELVYGLDGGLLCVDCRNVEMTPVQIDWLMHQCPRTDAELNTWVKGLKGGNIVREDVEITFDMFWVKYNRKINKDRCIKLWNRLSKVDQIKAYYGLDAYRRHLQANTWKSKADPETYLRNKYWQNEWK